MGRNPATRHTGKADSQDLASTQLTSAVPVQPVFIVGPHRSGTTILYKILAETGAFNVTTAYHILNRRRLLQIQIDGHESQARAELAAEFTRRGLQDREFDSVRISPDIPEEYAYALEYQGRRPRLNENNLLPFLQFCKTVQFVQDPSKPLLLKNPYDADNFMFLSRRVPGARFIFIHRNPVAIVNSQMRAVRSLLERKNEYVAMVSQRYAKLFEKGRFQIPVARLIYSSKFPLLRIQASATVARACDYARLHAAEIADRSIHLTYRDLCAAPRRQAERILSFLNAKATRDVAFERMIRSRDPEVLSEIKPSIASIQERNRGYIEMFGADT